MQLRVRTSERRTWRDREKSGRRTAARNRMFGLVNGVDADGLPLAWEGLYLVCIPDPLIIARSHGSDALQLYTMYLADSAAYGIRQYDTSVFQVYSVVQEPHVKIHPTSSTYRAHATILRQIHHTKFFRSHSTSRWPSREKEEPWSSSASPLTKLSKPDPKSSATYQPSRFSQTHRRRRQTQIP